MRFRLCCLSAVVILSVFLACGELVSTGGLSGTVRYRGEGPAEGVSITVDAADGGYSDRVQTNAQGDFLLAGLQAGAYRVFIEPGAFSVRRAIAMDVRVELGSVMEIEPVELVPAGSITGLIKLTTGEAGSGFRVQLLGTTLSAVSDDIGAFSLHRVPRSDVSYEILVEREDVGAARRAGILVKPFVDNDMGTISVTPQSDGRNGHPRFTVAAIVFEGNGTQATAAVRPLPYLLPEGTVRRFDMVNLRAPAEDPDGDALLYEWTASAGALTNALSALPSWQADASSGSGATLTVTVRDGHGGRARLSSDIEIANVFANSAHGFGSEVVHSYRIEGGPWLVDVVELSDYSVRPITRLVQSIGPRPLLVQDHVVFRALTEEGVRLRALPINNVGAEPVDIGPLAKETYEATPIALSNGDTLYFVGDADAGERTVVRSWTPLSGTVFAFECPGRCTGLAARNGVVAAFGQTSRVARVFGNEVRDFALSAPIGIGLALGANDEVAFIAGNSNRIGRNNVVELQSGGDGRTAYEGYYSLVLWAVQDNAYLFSEQEYRAMRHPPFIRLSDGRTFAGNADQNWMADKAMPFEPTLNSYAGHVLVRRITEADWPGAYDASRSEIVLVSMERGFE